MAHEQEHGQRAGLGVDTISPERPFGPPCGSPRQPLSHFAGRAVAIDVEEVDNTHPRDKQTVGQRLALVARTVAHGQKVEDSGPTFRNHTVRDGWVTLAFDHVASGLVSHSPNGELSGFAVAGQDCRFA